MQYQYKKLLAHYPSFVSKETFRIVCHISKRVARYYLQNGLVPCTDSGKKTRNYTIAMKDIVAFLIDREVNPEKYRLPRTEDSISPCLETEKPSTTKEYVEGLKSYHTMLFREYPDLLTVLEAAELCGYSKKVVCGWLQGKKIKYFVTRGAYRIPKECLIAYMIGTEYRGRKQPSLNK